MATYNGAKYLREQIDSILAQLGPADELVISDDGSTDDTVAIIRNYLHPQIRLLANEGVRGPVGNFSNAMMRAQGNFIALSDQDDVWMDGRLERMSGILAGLPPRSLLIGDLVQFGPVFRSDLDVGIGPTPRGSLVQLYRIFSGSAKYWGSTYLFDRALLSNILPVPSYIEAHDHWIAMQAILHGRVFHLEEPTVMHRLHAENVSAHAPRALGVRLKARLGYAFGLCATCLR
jgi:glycosyltransferase involved in cell wall biosynthesis